VNGTVECATPFLILICARCSRIRRVPVSLADDLPTVCCNEVPHTGTQCGGWLRPLTGVERMNEADAWQDGQLRWRRSEP
jgi:hypothetical protein